MYVIWICARTFRPIVCVIKQKLEVEQMIANWLVKKMIQLQVRRAYAGGFNLEGFRSFMKSFGMFARIPRNISVETVDLDGIEAMHFWPKNPLKNCASVLSMADCMLVAVPMITVS